MKALLEEQGVPGVDTLRNPAGLDLGARDAAGGCACRFLRRSSRRARTSAREATSPRAKAPAVPAATPAIAIDPVCHMEVDVATARYKADVDGVTYYFCCAGCKARFLKQPHDYLSHTA